MQTAPRLPTTITSSKFFDNTHAEKILSTHNTESNKTYVPASHSWPTISYSDHLSQRHHALPQAHHRSLRSRRYHALRPHPCWTSRLRSLSGRLRGCTGGVLCCCWLHLRYCVRCCDSASRCCVRRRLRCMLRFLLVCAGETLAVTDMCKSPLRRNGGMLKRRAMQKAPVSPSSINCLSK